MIQGKTKILTKTYLRATLSIQTLKLGLHSEKLASNCLSYTTASYFKYDTECRFPVLDKYDEITNCKEYRVTNINYKTTALCLKLLLQAIKTYFTKSVLCV
jgi:hypothetical protein